MTAPLAWIRSILLLRIKKFFSLHLVSIEITIRVMIIRKEEFNFALIYDHERDVIITF